MLKLKVRRTNWKIGKWLPMISIFRYSCLFIIALMLFAATDSKQRLVAQAEPFNLIIELGEPDGYAVRWHPTQPLLAVSTAKDLRIYNREFQLIDIITPTQQGPVRDLEWNATGDAIALRIDTTIEVWSYPNKHFVTQYTVDDITDSATFSWHPEDSLLAITDGDQVRLLEISDNAKIDDSRLSPNLGFVLDVEWHPNGEWLAISFGNLISILDMRTSAPITTLQHPTAHTFSNLTWSPDGARLASATRNDTIIIWDLTTREIDKELVGHRNAITHLDWSEQGLLSSSQDGRVRIWDVATAIATTEFAIDDIAAWSHDSQFIATEDQIIEANTATIWAERTVQIDSFVTTQDWCQNALAVPDDRGGILIWDTTNFELDNHIVVSNYEVLAVAWNHNCTQLLIANRSPAWNDSHLFIWNAVNNSTSVIHSIPEGITVAAWRGDDRYIAAGARDGMVHVIDTATLSINSFQAHARDIRVLAWNSSTNTLVTGAFDSDFVLKEWDIESSSLIREMTEAHIGRFGKLITVLDGDSFALSDNKEVLLINEGVQTLHGIHDAEITDLQVNPSNNAIIASTDTSGMIVIFDIRQNIVLHRFDTGSWVRSISWSDDGRSIAVSNALIEIWSQG